MSLSPHVISSNNFLKHNANSHLSAQSNGKNNAIGEGIVLIDIENLSIKLMILWNLVNLGPGFESITRWQKWEVSPIMLLSLAKLKLGYKNHQRFN
jgi:phosphoglucomutase